MVIRSSSRSRELRVVGEPGLPHQRRVRREARDPRVVGEREDPVEIGAVGEDACRDPLEHCGYLIGRGSARFPCAGADG